MFGPRGVLGIAFEEGVVRIAEVRDGRPRPAVVRTAEFVPPADAGIEQPSKMGVALGEFLAQQGFGAKRAVLGLPASWLMSRECSIPPATGDTLIGVLRIQAERAFSSAPGELAIDCVDRLDKGRSRPVLIVAALRSRLRQAVAAAEAAGLRVRAVTASSLALAAAVEKAGESLLLLRGAPGGAEMTVLAGIQPRLLRQVAADSVAEQVRRTLALLPQDEWWTSAQTLWGVDAGDGGPAWEEVARRLGVLMRTGEVLPALGVDGPEAAAAFATPIAVARSGLVPAGPPADFLHTHLTPHKKTRDRRKTRWAIAIGATLLLAIGAFLFDWNAQAAEVEESRDWLAGQEQDIASAQALIDKVAAARDWYDRRLPFLDCLREVTLAFPERGTVWATSLAVQEYKENVSAGGTVRGSMQGSVIGKAVDEQSALQVLDRLKASRALADVKLLYLRQAQAGASDVAFSMSFTYIGTE